MTFIVPGGEEAVDVATPRSTAPGQASTADIQRPHFLAILTTKEWIPILLLVLAALIPRLILAIQLDFLSDEPIYMIGGKAYFRLLTHLDFTSPDWRYNYEHPVLAKLLQGISIEILKKFGISSPLYTARVPSILLGTLLIPAIYLLGKSIAGRTVAFLAALSLAVSPWIVFWNSTAMLDTTMVTLITLACLVLWHAIRHPRLYALCGILIGLAGASKYTSALLIPGMILFVIYYYGFLRRTRPKDERQPLPWRWWLIGCCLIPVSFFIADPSIWADPLPRLTSSLAFSVAHSEEGHLTFWAGSIRTHVPPWMIFDVVFVKVSSFITIPAILFTVFAIVQVIRFHLRQRARASSAQPVTDSQLQKTAGLAFLTIWVVIGFLTYGRLNILVATHYYLPIAPPLFLAGACGLTIFVRALIRRLSPERPAQHFPQTTLSSPTPTNRAGINWRTALTLAVLAVALVGPHLLGLITIPDAEGYTSEFFPQGEDSIQGVTYQAYHDATNWIVAHSKIGGKIGLAGNSTGNWPFYHPMHQGNFEFVLIGLTEKTYAVDYLVWPMNFIQRGLPPPYPWNDRVVHTISGGKTTYAVIMVLNPSLLTT